MLAPVPGTRVHRMLRLKGWLGALLFATGLHRLLLRRRAVIVAFHRVDDRVRGNPIGVGVEEFRAYCDFFRRYFRVVPVAEIVRRLRAGEPMGGLLAITFDDGYLDNFQTAAPELRARGLPACFFVATELVGSRTQPWWDREYGARAWWMAWEQVRALAAQGFEVGAHTRSHANLGEVTGEAAREEIAGSRDALERELGRPVRLFSFPYGSPAKMTEENRRRVREAGFDGCFSAYGGTVSPGDDPFHLRRAPITLWHVSPAQFGFELLFRPPTEPAAG